MLTSTPGRSLLLGVVVVLAVTAALRPVGATPPDPPSESPFTDTQPLHYLAALDRLQVGDTSSAMAFLRRNLRQNPAHRVGFLLYVRLSLERNGPLETASWTKARLNNHGSARLLAAALALPGWSTDQRLDLLRWSEQQGLTHPRLRLMWIRLLLERGRIREGVRRVHDGLRARPNDYELNMLAGRLQLRRGKWTRAREHFQRGIRHRPGYPEGYYWMSILFREQGFEEKAREYRQRYRGLRRAEDGK